MAAKKTSAKTAKKQEEKVQVQDNSTPNVTARIDKMVDVDGSKVKAFASATIGDAYAIHGIRVMDSDKGLYVSMPSRSFQKDGKTEYSDVFHPVTAEAREELNGAVMNAYEQKLQEEIENGESEEEQSEDLEEDNAPVQQKMS